MTSKFDYNKEFKDSLTVGAFGTAALLGLGYLMGNNRPTLALTFKNAAILTGGIAGGDLIKDYCKQNKWFPFT